MYTQGYAASTLYRPRLPSEVVVLTPSKGAARFLPCVGAKREPSACEVEMGGRVSSSGPTRFSPWVPGLGPIRPSTSVRP